MSDFQLVVPVLVHHKDKEPFAGEFSLVVNYNPELENFTATATSEFVKDIKDNFDNDYYTLDSTRTIQFVPKQESEPRPKLVKPDLGGLEQYIGYQPMNPGGDDNLAMVFYLNVRTDNEGKFSMAIERETVECKFTKEEIQLHITDLFDQFSSNKIEPFTGAEYQWEKYKKRISLPRPVIGKMPYGIFIGIDSIDITIPWFRKFNAREKYYTIYEMSIGNQIAKRSRRGVGNTRFGDTLFYKGDSEFDCPIIISEKNGLYGIFKHPNFEQYGFNLIDG